MLDRLRSSKLSEFVDVGISLAIFRILVAFLMFFGHGWGKLMDVFSWNIEFGDPIGIGPTASLILAAFAEGICSLLIAAGFWTRFAALVLSINMFVAIFFFHIPNGDALFGGYELAAFYLISFIFIFLIGPGKYSVDSE
ncbi:MAG: DoxX family protein [Bacteroidota bacterium]